MVALMLSIIRLFVCYVPLAYAGSVYYGLTGFFVGALLGNFFMAAISYRLFTKQFTNELTETEVRS
jgi:Na+-driven multidrug efflux pump